MNPCLKMPIPHPIPFPKPPRLSHFLLCPPCRSYFLLPYCLFHTLQNSYFHQPLHYNPLRLPPWSLTVRGSNAHSTVVTRGPVETPSSNTSHGPTSKTWILGTRLSHGFNPPIVGYAPPVKSSPPTIKPVLHATRLFPAFPTFAPAFKLPPLQPPWIGMIPFGSLSYIDLDQSFAPFPLPYTPFGFKLSPLKSTPS